MSTAQGTALVVGGGPSGLLAAGILASAKIPVTVLEEQDAIDQNYKACTLHAGTMQVLDREQVPKLRDLPYSAMGHYLGFPIRLGDYDTPWAGVWKCPQPELTDRLAQWARAQGALLLRNQQVISLDQNAHRVRVTTAGGQSFSAGLLLAADGQKSSVRRLLRIRVAGPTPTRSMVRADIRICGMKARRFERIGQLTVTCAPISRNITRVMMHDPAWPVGQQISADSLRQVWAESTGEKLPQEVLWVDTFSDTTTRTERLAVGRVVFCGEAAGQFIPIGGAALNSSLLGAAALARKIVSAGSHNPVTQIRSWAESMHKILDAQAARIRTEARLIFSPGPEIEAERLLISQQLTQDRQYLLDVMKQTSWLNSMTLPQRRDFS